MKLIAMKADGRTCRLTFDAGNGVRFEEVARVSAMAEKLARLAGRTTDYRYELFKAFVRASKTDEALNGRVESAVADLATAVAIWPNGQSLDWQRAEQTE
jgi:hypothetical protein